MSICKFLLKTTAITGLFIAISAIGVSAASRASITGDVVNVRKEASTSSAILAKVEKGKELKLIAADGDWLQIELNGVSAYIASEFAIPVSVDGLVNGNGVNIRTAPNTTAGIVDQVSVGTVITATGICGDFYAFERSGKTVYIHRDFVIGDMLPLLPSIEPTEETPLAAIAVNAFTEYVLVDSSTGLKLRKGPSTDSDIITVLGNGDAADLITAGAEWHEVSYYGLTGYLSAEFSSIHTGTKPDNSIRNAVVTYAQKFLGTKYVWGGTNLTGGVDCSGFVFAVYRDFGYKLNRSSRDMINSGTRISKAELLPGDLVFFDTTNATNQNYISHVGIYIGGGQFIHSSSSSRTPYVTISSLSEAYYTTRYVSACRILN